MVLNGQVRDLPDIQPLLSSYSDRQGLVIQAITMAGGTSQFIHVGQHLIAGEVTRSFVVAAIDVGDDSFKRNVNIANPTKFILIMEMELLAIRPIKN